MDTNGSVIEETTYNNKNILFNKEDLEIIFKKYNIDNYLSDKNDINTYRKAFVHNSYCTRKNENFKEANEECPEGVLPLQEFSYERMEYLGDSLLNIATSHYLFERYPYEEEGFLARMKTKLVNGNMLAFLSEKSDFSNFMIISKQIEESEGRVTKSLLEDIFESFIGAMFLDFSKNINKNVAFEVVCKFIENVYETNIDFAELINRDNNYKDKLSKYFQHNFSSVPKFFEVNINIVNNKKEYTYCVKNNEDLIVGIGKEYSKKKAEQESARQALIYYGEL